MNNEECHLRYFYPDGKVSFEVLKDGTERSYYENGQMQKEFDRRNGKIFEWLPDGRKSMETLSDGTEISYFPNGQKSDESRDGFKIYDPKNETLFG